jgi:geranylgeranyl pyrophosphate synthase
MRNLISESGALDYAKGEINRLLDKSERIIRTSKINNQYRETLKDFSRKILAI